MTAEKDLATRAVELENNGKARVTARARVGLAVRGFADARQGLVALQERMQRVADELGKVLTGGNPAMPEHAFEAVSYSKGSACVTVARYRAARSELEAAVAEAEASVAEHERDVARWRAAS